MLYRAILAACFAAVTSAPAAAQEKQDATASKPAKEKKICRRAIATGSIMAKTTCRTKEEWGALSERGQADLDRTRDQERSRSAMPGM